jgi:RNA ligase
METLQERLNRYIGEGWIRSQIHPSLDLTIYNYTQETQFEKKWDDLTLMCRGLVLNSKGIIVARPFEKFFNWEEVIHTLSKERLEMPFEIFTKMDGSLGIIFMYEGELVVASRGSFTSDQCLRATKIIEKYRMSLLTDKDVYEATGGIPGDKLTLLFEIIYKENRIVVDFGDLEELVLLGAIETVTGKEIDYVSLEGIASVLGCPIVQKHHIPVDRENGLQALFSAIRDLNLDNEEGYIIKYPDLRMKVKFPEYCALHRIMTQCSSYDIWENLMMFNKLPEELLSKIPDELYTWVKALEEDLRANYNFIEATVRAEHQAVMNKLQGTKPEELDKAYALRIMKNPLRSFLFAYKNGKDISEMIWKKIKPDYERPFDDKG